MHYTIGPLLALQAFGTAAKTQFAAAATCNANIPNANHKQWYNECTAQLYHQEGETVTVQVGTYERGGGCRCSYRSTVPGMWPVPTKSLWDAVMDKDPSCSDAMYYDNAHPGGGYTYLRFLCR
jgi:hypothetical protein